MTMQEFMEELEALKANAYTRAKRNSNRQDELERDGDEDASLIAAGRTFAYLKTYHELTDLLDKARKEGIA